MKLYAFNTHAFYKRQTVGSVDSGLQTAKVSKDRLTTKAIK